MSSPFEAAMAAADAVIGSTFGEALLITPQRAEVGELKAASIDTGRSARTVTGVFTMHGASERLGGVRQGTELRGMTTFAMAPAQVWFSAKTLAELGYRLASGDRITRVEKPGRPSFAIAKREQTDLDDGTFPLVKA